MVEWVQKIALEVDTKQTLKATKDGIILINHLYVEFSSVNCLNINQPLKELSEVYKDMTLQSLQFFVADMAV